MGAIIEQASSFASEIDNLILLILVLGGFWFLVAEIVLFAFIFKYRRSKNRKAKYITGTRKEEKRWLNWPHYMIIVCDLVIIFFAIKVWYDIKQHLPPAQEVVRVVGRQWAWQFVHPGLDKQLGTDDDVETVDELRLKVGTMYHFKLESRDVLHSFSVPVFRLKQDAVPGRVFTGWFEPTKTGTYDIQCAEMCGMGHGMMHARLVIETEKEHDKWLQTRAKPASSG